MLVVPFIPLFLDILVHRSVDDSIWKDGPEYVFDVEMDLMLIPIYNRHAIQESNYTLLANLICRPKELDSLSCYLRSVNKDTADMTADNNVDVPETDMWNKISEEPFEMKFNNHGIDHLIVNEDIFTYKLNLLKRVAELLSIGADLDGRPDGFFETAENSTIGQCNVRFGITHSEPPTGPQGPRILRYMFTMLPQLKNRRGEFLVIDKETNLNNCSFYATFYYGKYGKNTVVEEELGSDLITSVSAMVISDTQFVSTLKRNGSMGSFAKANYSAMMQSSTLTLKGIRPAAGELPVVKKASKTSITANSVVERIL